MSKKKCSSRITKASLSSAVLLSLILGGQVFAADNIVVDSGTATGTTNTVTDDKTARVVGTENSVTGSEDANVFGDTNTVENSNGVNIVGNDNKVTKSYPWQGGTRYEASVDTRVLGNNNEVRGSRKQNVIGDNNKIIGRDVGTVTDYGHPEGREPNISDLTIGRGNVLTGNHTYRNEWDSLTVIGNNNDIDGSAAGIIIGDNQKGSNILDSIIIGSLSPEEKKTIGVGNRKMVVIGYHALGADGTTAIGHRVQSLGPLSTAVGTRSTIEGMTVYSSLYGVDNKLSSENGMGVSIATGTFGTLNKVDSSLNSMVFGTGNRVTNAAGNMTEGIEGGFMTGRWGELFYHAGDDFGYTDRFSEVMGEFATLNGGSVFALGNGNVSDYARRSSILGTGNILNGTETAVSDYNMVTGYQNKAINVNHVSVMGSGNTLSDATTDVVIGDYHTLSGSKNNVILGTMGTKVGYEEQSHTPKSFDHVTGNLQWTGDTLHYAVKVQKPLREHTENISNAVMLGYNTDVQHDGGVAIGSNSVASVDKGAYGYNPITGKAFESKAAIVAYAGKEARFAELNSSILDLESALLTAKADYETKISDYLAKNADYVQAVNAYNGIDHDSDQGRRIKEQMDAAKTANDEARAAMDSAESSMNDANKAYTAAVSEKNQITSVWQSNAAAVSVGDRETGLTRQITNVAAGTEDTDAVNVAQLKSIQTQLDSNSVHYFSTKSSQTSTDTNYLNDGATGTDSMVIGINSKSSGNNSVVLGNGVSVVGNKNNFNSSIVVGQNIDVDGTHNAVFATDYENGDYKSTKVFGEQNTVLGVGNLVGYTAVQNGNEWTYTKNDYGSDQNVAVGLLNTVSGGSIAVGTSSHVNTLGTSFGHANSIEGSMMEGGQWRVALGNYLTVKGEMGLAVGNSAKVDGDWAIAIGNNNHDETTTTAQGTYAIALGTNAKATNTSALALGTSSTVSGFYATALGTATKATAMQSVALGSFSTADRDGGAFGYDPLTKKVSTSSDAAWKSVLGAVSVGGQVNYSDGTTGQATRQITNVAAGSADTDAVNVAQLKQVQQNISDAVKEGKTTIEAGDNITVTKGSTENSYKITAKDTTLKDSDSALKLDGNKLKLEIEDTAGNKVSGSVELDKIGSAIDTKNTIAKAEGGHIDFTTKANDVGGTEYSLSVVTDGKVESGNTGIVTGDTVYNETRVAKDGNYIKQTNTAAENLSVLDSQVKTNTESITNINNNVINLNSQVNKLDSRINRVGAGAAALAALHPLDYDSNAKWDFAAGYGNYKSASAVAVGAFYRPSTDMLFSIGTSMGGGENMFNAGVSMKFGQSSPYASYSKSELVNVISEQSKEINAMKADNEAIKADNEAKAKRIDALEEQMKAILQRLNS